MSITTSLSTDKDSILAEKDDVDDVSLVRLNYDLNALVTIFPNIQPVVFREMLHIFGQESRLLIVVEQLLRNQDSWVKGRWRTATEVDDSGNGREKRPASVAVEDQFRRASYKWASQVMLFDEFKVLSRSTIKAVLAEENFSYTRSRSTLQKLAARTWRSSFNNLWSKWRKSAKSAPVNHFMMIWPRAQDSRENSVPTLRETGDAELDRELHQNVLAPFLKSSKKLQELNDWELALTLNRAEAEHARAVYECQCCYSDTTFEQMATCTTGAHVICFRCICQSVVECLFGQSWGQNVDHTRGQIKCLAPTSEESCEGCIPQHRVRLAISQSGGGRETLIKLDSRLADEALLKACLPLVRCPFCIYAEVDDPYYPPSTVQYTISTECPRASVFLLLVMLNFLPLLLFYSLLCRLPLFQKLPTISSMFSISLARLSRSRHLSRRFQCQSLSCGFPSCLTCQKVWRDPHICHESATLSLRTTIEAARTAALKRTCPRCGIGFIKESGCNKLTCVCGYSMCYVCRQGLGQSEGGEGYRHFCQHFRPASGPCRQCERCDLYKNEDDEASVMKAGARAEREWREREGMAGVDGTGGGQEEAANRHWWEKKWTMQASVDWWVRTVLAC